MTPREIPRLVVLHELGQLRIALDRATALADGRAPVRDPAIRFDTILANLRTLRSGATDLLALLVPHDGPPPIGQVDRRAAVSGAGAAAAVADDVVAVDLGLASAGVDGEDR